MSSTTAIQATAGYVPPFAKTTATAVAQASTTVFASIGFLTYQDGNSATTTTTAPIVDKTGGVDSNSLTEYFFIPYIDAHSLSVPTWRYAYILWILLIGILVFWSLIYHFSPARSSGIIGAWFRKWTIRRVVIGGKVRHEEKSGNQFTVKRKKSWTSPTIAQMLAVLGLIGLCVCLTVLGDDFIKPTTCTFGGECSYNSGAGSGPPKSSYGGSKRSLTGATSWWDGGLLIKRGVNNPSGWAPFNDPLLAGPNYNIKANLWASSGRLGLISYAMIPLAITLALKQWPFNIWATPFLIGYHFDKTAILHRWSGRVIWLFSTAHTLTWGAQLLKDKDPFGRATLIPAFHYWRFVAGVAAYGILTILVILSLSSIRNRFYELFWWSHAFLVIALCVGCIMHTSALMWWPIVGLAIWGAERLTRAIALVWINSIGYNKRPSKASNRDSFSVIRAEKEQRYSESKEVYGGYTYPPAPHFPQDPQERQRLGADGFPREFDNDNSYFDRTASPRPPTYSSPAPTPGPFPRSASTTSNLPVGPLERNLEATRPPPGYAQAQLLPGRTIRLTITTPRAVRWLPGQHIFLTLPGVKFGALQSHPYTIISVDERAAGVAPLGGNLAAPTGGSNIVLLIRAQKGFSKTLWDHVVEKRRQKEGSGAGSLELNRGVNMRAFVGWPLGSAGRTSWQNFDSTLIICGGTGVTFGISVLEYLCRRMARRDAIMGGDKKDSRFKTTRVRFVWILREYAHLSWVAPTLRRCLEMSKAGQLQVDLFVSRDQAISNSPPRSTPIPHPQHQAYSAEEETFVPPVRPFARQPRSASRDSMRSDMSDTEEETPLPDAYREADETIDSITDLVLFDGEDDAPSPEEAQISATIRKEGKIRRAFSRRDKNASQKQSRPKPSPHAPLREHSFDKGGQLSNAHSPSQSFSYSRSATASPYGPSSPFAESTSFADLGNFDASDSRSFAGASSTRQLLDANRSGIDLFGQDSTYLDMTPEDREDLEIISELARPGHPRLDQIMDAEISSSAGRTMVACCGPTSLNTVVRHLVSSRINLRQVRKGNAQGDVSLVCEDFSF